MNKTQFQDLAGSEIFPLVDEQGNVIGKATRKECHSGSKILHPVVHLHLFDDKGRLYLQKRLMSKDIQPGKWDTSVGGHVDLGESIETALIRESEEELGLLGFTPEYIDKYVFESEIEKELVHVYKTVFTGLIKPNTNELERGDFFAIPEVESMISQKITTPNFSGEYLKYRDILLCHL